MTNEMELYQPIKDILKDLFEDKFGNCYLEITANGVFSNTIKKIVQYDIIFPFLGKKASPDITGFIHLHGNDVILNCGPSEVSNRITVEIKRSKINVQDIYQAKMYGDLFLAKYALLISSEPLSEELERLDKQISISARFMSMWKVYIGQYCVDDEGRAIVSNWFPSSPF